MLSSEDKILIKTCGNLKDPPEDWSRNSLTKIERTNIGQLSVKKTQPVLLNMMQEAVCHKHPKLQVTLPQWKTQLRGSYIVY